MHPSTRRCKKEYVADQSFVAEYLKIFCPLKNTCPGSWDYLQSTVMGALVLWCTMAFPLFHGYFLLLGLSILSVSRLDLLVDKTDLRESENENCFSDCTSPGYCRPRSQL